MKVIAISGWKRSGKDTAANELINKHGYTRVAFADLLKDMVAKEYDIPRTHCDDPDYKEAPILHLPVTPKDAFTLNMANLLFNEFRTAGGQQAMEPYVDPSGTFLGVMGRHVEQLYWTPRALCILKGSVNRAVRSDFWVQAAIFAIEDQMHHTPQINPDIGDTFVISDLRYRSEVEQLRQAFGKNLVTVRVNRFDTVATTDPSERDLDNYNFDVTLENKGTIEEFVEKVNKLTKE